MTAAKIKNSAVSTNKLANNAVTSAKLADNAVTTSKIANGAVTSEKVKDGSLTGADFNVSTLGTVPSAASAQPVSFAQVSEDGVLNPANSKNVGAVKHNANEYCFSGIPFAPKGGNATVDFNDSGFDYAQVGLGNHNGNCPTGTQAFVVTLNSENTADEAGFFVTFYG